MKKRNFGKKIFSTAGKSFVEILCVVMVVSMVLGAVSVVIENMGTNKATSTGSYVIYGIVYHPYVKRPVYNATVVLWNLRTNETNVTSTNETGYYNVDLNEAGISHQTGDEIRILTYYMHYSDNRTITIAGNSSHEVEIKLKNNNHFNNYMAPDDIGLNLTIPEFNETFEDDLNLTEPDFNFTEPEMPDFENSTYPENSTKRLPNLTVSDVSYDKLILGNQTQLNITIKNINNDTAYNVAAEVYYESNDDELLGVLSYGNIAPNETKTESVLWTPTIPDINNLKIIIYVGDLTENTIIIGFYVRPTVMSGYGNHTFTPPEAAPPVQGNWEIKTDVIVENEEIWLEGDLIIYPGATLTFKKNVRLIMMPRDPPYQHIPRTIEVQSGARFEILGEKGAGVTMITAQDETYPFEFLCRGSLSIKSSQVWFTYGDRNNVNNPGGIQVLDDGVCTIEDSLITRGYTHNIYSAGQSVTIRNSNISYAGQRTGVGYGVYLTQNATTGKSASLYLDDTIVRNSADRGIYAYRSGVHITGSEITENNYGVYLDEANPEVKIYTDCLSDGSGEKTVEFPTGGGYDTSANLVIPERASVTSAKMKLRGMREIERDVKTEMNILPEDDGWTLVSEQYSSAFVSGGILTIQPSSESPPGFVKRSYHILYGVGNNGFTIESRCHITPDSNDATFIQFWASQGTDQVCVYIFKDYVSFYGETAPNDATQYHVYRITQGAGGLPKRLYIDGNLVIEINSHVYGPTIYVVQFLMSTEPEAVCGTTKWDYVYYSIEEAFEPIYPTNPTLSICTIDSGWHPSALSFDGVDDYVEIPHSESLDITYPITIEAWVKLDALEEEYSTIVTKTESDGPGIYGYDQYVLVLDEGRYPAYWAWTTEDDWVHVTAVTPLTTGVWYHLAATYDGSHARIYIDGTLDNELEKSRTPYTNNEPVRIGSYPNTDGRFGMKGVIDEVRILNTVLDPDEIQEDYKLGRYQRRDGTVAWYHFDKDLNDYSGYGNDGTFLGEDPIPWYGVFDRWETVDFTEGLKQYLETGEYKTLDGNIIVPLKLTSDTAGEIKISDIKIEWETPTTVEHTIISRSTFNTDTYGIVSRCSSPTETFLNIKSNEILRVDTSIWIENCSGEVKIENNLITSEGRREDLMGYNIGECGIRMDFSSVTITGNNITNFLYGIFGLHSTLMIKGNLINGYGSGIGLGYSPETSVIMRNTVRSCFWYGIDIVDSPVEIIQNTLYNNNVGIFVDESNILIKENIITENVGFEGQSYRRGYGIWVAPYVPYGGSYGQIPPVVDSNIISSNQWGIVLLNMLQSRIMNNNIYSNERGGIYLSSSSENEIINCDIYSNTEAGILLSSSSNHNTIRDCDIWDNTYGVYVDGSSATIESNEIKENRGIGIYSTSSTVEIENNYILDNIDGELYACGIYAENTAGTIRENAIKGHIATYRHVWSDSLSEGENEYTIGGGIRCENAEITIGDNNICNNGNGITLVNGIATIENNDISDNLGTYYLKSRWKQYDPRTHTWRWSEWHISYSLTGTGIATVNSVPTISNNNIQNNQEGIYLDGESIGEIFNNDLFFDKDVFERGLEVDLWGIVTDGAREDYEVGLSSATWTIDDVVTVKSTLKKFSDPDFYVYPMQIVLAGSLDCLDGAKLTFQNVEFRAACWYSNPEAGTVERTGIEMQEGTKAYIYSDFDTEDIPAVDMCEGWEHPSGFTADNIEFPYTFKVLQGAKFELKDSVVEHCGYYEDESTLLEDRGFYLASNDVTIERCIFRNNYYGLIADGIRINITSSRFADSDIYDLYLMNGADIYCINTVLHRDGNMCDMIYADTNSILNIAWYVDVMVYNPDGTSAEDATVIIYDARNIPTASSFTRRDGRTPRLHVREVRFVGTATGVPAQTDYIPITILVLRPGVGSDEVTFNTLTQSMIENNAVVLTLANQPPTLIQPLPDITFPEDSANIYGFDLDLYFRDRDMDTITYTAIGAVNVIASIGADNVVTFSAPPNWNGAEAITFRATDPSNAYVEDTITVTVTPVNDAPSFTTTPPTTATEDALYTYDADAADEDGGPLTYSLLSAPAGMAINSATGIISWTPTNDDVGVNTVVIQVSDGFGGFATQTFTITVANQNDVPILVEPLPDVTFDEDPITPVLGFDLDLYFGDPDDDTLTYIWAGNVNINVWIDINNYIFFDTIFAPDWNGAEAITFTATDPDGATVNDVSTVTVLPVPDAPILFGIPNQSFDEDTPLANAFDLDDFVFDADLPADFLIYSVVGNDNILVVINLDGTVDLSAPPNWSGAEDIVFTVTDAFGLAANQEVTVNVIPVNDPPIANAGPDQTTNEDIAVVLDSSDSFDIDGDALTYIWDIDNIVDSNNDGTFDNDPDLIGRVVTVIYTVPGTYTVTLMVTDGIVTLPSADTCTITVNNVLPVANAGPDQTVVEDATVVFDGGDSTASESDLPLIYIWDFDIIFDSDGDGDPANDIDAIGRVVTTSYPFQNLVTGYTVCLTVIDAEDDTATDTCTIFVANVPPIADAGPDQTVGINQNVLLNGAGSTDTPSDLPTLVYTWDFNAAVDSDGDGIFNNDPDGVGQVVTTSYTIAGTYIVTITVTDNDGAQNQDACTISVGPDLVPTEIIYDPTAQTLSATIQNNGVDAVTNVVVNFFVDGTLLTTTATTTDNFETGAPGWTTGAAPDTVQEWELGTPTYGPITTPSGTNCWGTDLDNTYNSGTHCWLMSPVYDLTGSAATTQATLTFWRWYWFGANDEGHVEISTDGGTTWTILATYTARGDVWTQTTISLNAYIGNNNIRIRFRIRDVPPLTANGALRAGFYIDDVTVSINGASPVIPFIDSGGTATATIPWAPPGGTYNIQVNVDPQNNIAEANENNNQLTQPITVSSKSLFRITVDYFIGQVGSKYTKLPQYNNKIGEEDADILVNIVQTIISHINDTIATPL